MATLDGKRYDIKRATILHNWNNRKLGNDPDYLSESLYRKRTGEYFLYGMGGANTRYGQWEGVTGRAGDKIMPLTPAEARLWTESHATEDEYAEIFSVLEKAPMRFNSVSPEIRQKMERIREETGQTLTEIFEEAIKEYQG